MRERLAKEGVDMDAPNGGERMLLPGDEGYDEGALTLTLIRTPTLNPNPNPDQVPPRGDARGEAGPGAALLGRSGAARGAAHL